MYDMRGSLSDRPRRVTRGVKYGIQEANAEDRNNQAQDGDGPGAPGSWAAPGATLALLSSPSLSSRTHSQMSSGALRSREAGCSWYLSTHLRRTPGCDCVPIEVP